MRSLLFVVFFFALAVLAEEELPAGVSSDLVSHVKENGLEQVMRAKRFCGCCGGCCGCGCMCGTGGPTGCPCMGCCG